MKKIGVLLITIALTLAPAGLVLAQKAPAKSKPTQTVCPVFEGEINKDIFVDYKGKRIYFCCEGCDEEFKKNPEKYLKKLEAQGVELEKSPAAAGKKGK
ncbi:MAG: YHS domain-containing protein [Thermodesulfobacteriota bacterium]